MARQSSDRDDLMAEVITYSPRVSLLMPGFSDMIVAGRRSDGRWSVFLGGDTVYHFDQDGRLRRAFVNGDLYRSQGLRLSRLKRQQTDTETVLLRHDLDAAELQAFRNQVCHLLLRLATAITGGQATVQQAIPPDVDFLPELATSIHKVVDAGCPLAEGLKRG
jgi:hypothetical protein